MYTHTHIWILNINTPIEVYGLTLYLQISQRGFSPLFPPQKLPEKKKILLWFIACHKYSPIEAWPPQEGYSTTKRFMQSCNVGPKDFYGVLPYHSMPPLFYGNMWRLSCYTSLGSIYIYIYISPPIRCMMPQSKQFLELILDTY